MSQPLPAFASALEDRYRIERELASGGMATVYLATDVRHGRHVAVKVLRPEIASAVGVDRFLAEIRTTANLQHPHILGLIDSGAVVGQVFYVMPFISGETLQERLRDKKQLPVADAVRIAVQVASALDYAHRQGVIHRDIKPANIMLQDGQAMVADFGIALGVARAGTTRLTDTGIAVGTPAYMSPEQAMGERDLTVGSDVFALGCVLYEMLTGETPFSGPTAQAIAGKVMSAEPEPVTSLRRSVPAHVAAAVHTALQKLPADRFTSAEAFAEALSGPQGASHSAPASGAASRRWNSWAAAIVLIAAGSALGWIVRGIGARASEPIPVSHHSIILPEGTLFSTYPLPWGLALSPDGETLVYAASVDRGAQQLFVKRPGDLNPAVLPGTEEGVDPFFSPDGTWVAFFAEGSLKKVSIGSGSVEVIARLGESEVVGRGSWGDDGNILFGMVTDEATVGIASVPSAGGPVTMVSRPDTGSGAPWHLAPQRLPGTDMLLYTATSSFGNGRVMARPVAGGAERLVLDRARFARYLGNDRIIYEVAGDVLVARFDPHTLSVSEPARVLSGVIPDPLGRSWAAASNVLLYRPRTSRALVWVRRDGLRTRLGFPLKDYSTPALSPDGDRVAVIAGDEDRSDSWIGDLRREIMTRVSSDGLTLPGLLWTPDGEGLTVSRLDGAALSLYSQGADGSGRSEALLRNGMSLWAGGWTRDSRALIVMQGDSMSSGGDLLLLDVTRPGTLPPLVQTPASEWGGRLSPDQRWLAYFSDISGRYELYVTAFPGGGRRWQVSREGGGEVVWSRDGRELYFRNGNQMLAVRVKAGATFDWDPPKVLFEGSFYFGGGPGLVHYDVSPDGSRFLMIEDAVSGVPRFNVLQGWDRLVTRGAGTAPPR